MKQKLILLLLTGFTFFSYSQENNWKHTKEKDGITVYTREKEGYDIKEFKAIITIENYDFEKICQVILDSDNGEKWIADVKEAKFIEKRSTESTTTYFELSLPWPFDGRDMLLDNTITKTDKELNLLMKSNSSRLPEQENLIRMTKAEGSWKVKKLDEGKVDIEYIFIGDPAGNIPTWVINMFIIDGPLTTISNLLERSKSF